MVLIAASSEPAQAAFPGTNGTIAFLSDRDGNFEIYSMNPDGTSQVNLTRSSADDELPAYSANGENIAFVSDRDGNEEIYRMTRTGTLQTRLTNTANPEAFWLAFDGLPRWSPGRIGKIVFASDRDGNTEIYKMNTDGTGVQR